MTTACFSERPEDRTETAEDLFSNKQPVTVTDSRGQTGRSAPAEAGWFGSSQREQLELNGYYLTCAQVGRAAAPAIITDLTQNITIVL